MLRSHLNRLILIVGLVVVLPAVAVGERLHRGTGRRIAVASILRIGRLCGIHIRVHGAERLDGTRSYLLAPNHTSPMDIAAVLVARPDARFVAAAELFRIPLLGAAMRALGTVPIARGDRASSHQRIDELSHADGARELVMFPEGGIAPTDALLPFKTGPFVVAISTGASVVPVAISGASDVLPRRGRLRIRPGTVDIRMLDQVSTTGLDLDDRRSLADEVRGTVARSLQLRSAA